MDSDSLTIAEVTEGDEGVYTCIMNTTLDHDSASAELSVVGTYPTRARPLARSGALCIPIPPENNFMNSLFPPGNVF